MKACRLISVLVTFALIFLQTEADPYDREIVLEGAIGQIMASSQLAQHYDSLAEMLGDKRKRIEDEADIYEIVGQVKKITETWDSTFVLSKLFKQKPSTEAIKLFALLPSGIIQCNFQGYLILASNYAAAIANERYLKPTDQVKSSVWTAIEVHGQICRSEYFQRFMDRYNEISPKLMDELKQLLNYDMLGKIFPLDLKSALRTKNLLEGFKKSWAESLLDRLILVVKESSDSKYLRDFSSNKGEKSEFELHIIDNYLIEPCRSFAYELNDILEPAKLDLALDDNLIREISQDDSYLLRDTWKRYLVCSMIHINSFEVSQELTNLAKKRI